MTTPAVSKPVAEERLRAVVAEYAMHGALIAHDDEIAAACDELLAARTRLALLDGAREAISYSLNEMDGWIEALTKSLADPDYGIALDDHAKFICDCREELEARKRHAVALRRLAGGE